MSDALSSGHPALRAFFHMRGRKRSTSLAWRDYYESITETTKIKMKMSQSIRRLQRLNRRVRVPFVPPDEVRQRRYRALVVAQTVPDVGIFPRRRQRVHARNIYRSVAHPLLTSFRNLILHRNGRRGFVVRPEADCARFGFIRRTQSAGDRRADAGRRNRHAGDVGGGHASRREVVIIRARQSIDCEN